MNSVVQRHASSVMGVLSGDLREALYAKAPSTALARRQSGAVTRKLRLLRAHLWRLILSDSSNALPATCI